jgi:hypothetical protein
MMMGGTQYSYFTSSYSAENGMFKGELVLNQHTPPPSNHVLFLNEKDVGTGISGSYEGDQAQLTGTALVGKRSLTLHPSLRDWPTFKGLDACSSSASHPSDHRP